MSSARSNAHPRSLMYHVGRLTEAASWTFAAGAILNESSHPMPQKVEDFTLGTMALSGMAVAFSARVGDFLRLVLNAPNPLRAMKDTLTHLGCDEAVRGGILFSIKEMLAMGLSMGSAIALATIAHAQDIFSLNGNDTLSHILQFPLSIPAMLGSVGYGVHLAFSKIINACSEKLSTSGNYYADDDSDDEDELARCQLIQKGFKYFFAFVNAESIGLIVRDILRIEKLMRLTASRIILYPFALLQPFLDVINALAFSKKTIAEIMDDSVSQMWGLHQDRIFFKFAGYHSLRLLFSTGIQISTIELANQVAVSMGDNPHAIANIKEFSVVLFSSFFCQTFATELVFDTAFKKLFYTPVSQNSNTFFGARTNIEKKKQELLASTDEEERDLVKGSEAQTSSDNGGDFEIVPTAKRRQACGIL